MTMNFPRAALPSDFFYERGTEPVHEHISKANGFAD